MKKTYILFLLIISCLSGCNARQSEKQKVPVTISASPSPDISEKTPYLSITESYYSNAAETDIGSKCIVYNIQTKEIEEKGSVNYTSGYPLTTYSEKFNDIFFSAYSGRGDQIYKYNNNQNIQMTDKFYSINHMLSCGDKIFIAAKLLKHYCMEPFIFDPVSKECTRVFPDKKDDRFTWFVGNVPELNSVLFSYRSDNKERECGVNECSTSRIALLNMETGQVRQIYKLHKYIWGVAGNKEKLYILCAKSGVQKRDKNILYEIDMATKEKRKLKIPIVATEKLSLWDNILYCIGRNTNGKNRGIYAINLSTLKADLVFPQEKGAFINGFSMCY